MKKIQILALAILISGSTFAQKVPVTFETGENGADWTWAVFENDDNPALEIVDNPFKTGINESNTVAKFTARVTGEPHAGCESLHGSDIGSYKIDATNSTITLMVYKSVKSDVGIKLVTASGWSKGQLKVANTKVNEWEELSFDFSTVNHEDMTYDQIVIFPDFNARGAETVNYFDNLTIGGRTIGINKLESSNLIVFPNPATDQLNIDFSYQNNTIINYSLRSTLGQLVFNKEVNKLKLNDTVNTSDFETGIYILEIVTTNGVVTKKVILK